MSTVSRTTRYRNLTGKGNGTATFTYDTSRPLQVTVAFDGTPWTFLRDVLALREPGLSDVTCRTNGLWFYLDLSSNNGTATMRFVAAQVAAFLTASRRLVPFGAEVLEPEIGYDAEWELSLLGGER